MQISNEILSSDDGVYEHCSLPGYNIVWSSFCLENGGSTFFETFISLYQTTQRRMLEHNL